MYTKSFKRPTILTISLMICKRYLSLINIIENKGLFSPFFFENDKVQGYKNFLNYPGKMSELFIS